MISKKYYIDLEAEAFVDNPQEVEDKSNLVIITDLHFSYASKTESLPDASEDEESRKSDSERKALRTTTILAHVLYNVLNSGEAGTIVKPVGDITKMTVMTDAKGNNYNAELEVEELPDKEEIMNMIIKSVCDNVKSNLRNKKENSVIRQAVSKLNEEFSLLIK